MDNFTADGELVDPLLFGYRLNRPLLGPRENQAQPLWAGLLNAKGGKYAAFRFRGRRRGGARRPARCAPPWYNGPPLRSPSCCRPLERRPEVRALARCRSSHSCPWGGSNWRPWLLTCSSEPCSFRVYRVILRCRSWFGSFTVQTSPFLVGWPLASHPSSPRGGEWTCAGCQRKSVNRRISASAIHCASRTRHSAVASATGAPWPKRPRTAPSPRCPVKPLRSWPLARRRSLGPVQRWAAALPARFCGGQHSGLRSQRPPRGFENRDLGARRLYKAADSYGPASLPLFAPGRFRDNNILLAAPASPSPLGDRRMTASVPARLGHATPSGARHTAPPTPGGREALLWRAAGAAPCCSPGGQPAPV
eukprot:12045995-Alexandrium_andersonii.AAC.1